VLIAGFGFLVVDAIDAPFGNGSAFLLLIPMVVLLVLVRRWLRGGRALLILVDLVIAAIGLLGAWATGFGTSSIGGFASPFELEDLGVIIATIAAMVALVSAFHPMGRSGSQPPPAPSPAPATA